MALDGVTISCVVHEIKALALGGRVDKIYQPERDEVIIVIRSFGTAPRLLLTASPSHPRLHFTGETKKNPAQAPLFCMVMRKHFSGAKLTDVTQPAFERIVELHFDCYGDMGDIERKKIVIEIMGRHSNIILVDARGVIIDAVKRISHETSSVREVLPGKPYVMPPGRGKLDPMNIDAASFMEALAASPARALDALYQAYNGISPFLAGEFCFRAGTDPDAPARELSEDGKHALFNVTERLVNDIKSGHYEPAVLFDGGKPCEFTCVPMTMLSRLDSRPFDSASAMMDFFYAEKDSITRMSQKSADVRKLVKQNIERCVKKRETYKLTFRDIKDRESLKVMGELLTANIHAVSKGMTSFTAQNYLDEALPDVTIPLDPQLTPAENAQRYFAKYGKDKRAFAALTQQSAQNVEEMAYLEGLLTTLDTCIGEGDEAALEELREEMAEQGYARKRRRGKAPRVKRSKPLHFVSGGGFDIYVGKNNKQNDELTLRFARAGDMWLHTKDIPGSHVIVRAEGQKVPDAALNEAALLAAWFSKGRGGSHIPVDYTEKKNVKKPSGAKPGMVIYDNYKTAYVTPLEDDIKKIEQKD